MPAFDPVTGAKLTAKERGLLRDEDRYNQLGGSIGGPIWKNRVFAFFAYEGQSQNSARDRHPVVPDRRRLRPLAPANSIASTYLNFKGAAVLGTVIASATCAECRTHRRRKLRNHPRPGLEHWFAADHRPRQAGPHIR